eukprot:1138189-Alexandrium_andersonii.AAC.1
MRPRPVLPLDRPLSDREAEAVRAATDAAVAGVSEKLAELVSAGASDAAWQCLSSAIEDGLLRGRGIPARGAAARPFRGRGAPRFKAGSLQQPPVVQRLDGAHDELLVAAARRSEALLAASKTLRDLGVRLGRRREPGRDP